MTYEFGIPTDCPKCKTLNRYCTSNPDYWDEKGEQFVEKDITDFGNIFNYIEWICETQTGFEMQVSRWEEVTEYLKKMLIERDEYEKMWYHGIYPEGYRGEGED